jgi:DNA-binding GntR family transcriptional regulator
MAEQILDDHSFSFSRSAAARGLRFTTDVLEQTARVALPVDQEDSFYAFEQRAQAALGIEPDSPLLVIVRVRLFDGRPAAIQRTYLNPARFPAGFLQTHDFRTESLTDIYQRYGHTLLSRDTVLEARLANLHETNDFRRYDESPRGLSVRSRVVLDAEQQLYAHGPQSQAPFVLEFLKASYLENWKYEIKNRPAGTAGSSSQRS